MGSKFSSALTTVNGICNLKIVGVIDEDNELASLEKRLGAGLVVIELSEIERINSLGVRDWVSWLGRIEQRGTRPVFVNCSPAIVSQLNMVPAFRGNGIVKSFYAPYFCSRCKLEKQLRLEARNLAEFAPVTTVPSCRCDKCGQLMDFDEMEESFFSFLNQSKKLYREPHYEGLLQELAAASSGKVAALPGVRLPQKRRAEPKPTFSPSLVRRLIQNILPTEADFRAFCIDYFPQMQARLSDGMDRLRQVNLLLESERLDAITEQLRIQAIESDINWNDLISDLQAIESPDAEQDRERQDEIEKLYDERDDRREQGIAADDINEKIRDIKRELQLAPTLQEREVLGERYCLLQVVGRGGFATVWKARDRDTHRVVAVKVLHAHQGEDTRRMDRFIRGAQRMQQLNHPHIVRVLHGPDRHRGFHYFVMDYVPGGDLSHAVSSGKITVDAALKAVLEIGSALSFAHKNDLIHRDVKPENILLDAQGKACLTDFDLVWAADSTGGTGGGALGTLLYAAPEVMLDAGQVDQRADVYSLAMTTLFVLHGQKLTDEAVYERDSFFAELKCSSALRELVRHGTRRKPENRPATVAVFCDELRKICAAGNIKPVAATPIQAKIVSPAVASAPVESIPPPRPSARSTERPGFVAVAGLMTVSVFFGAGAVILYGQREVNKLEQVLQQERSLNQERDRLLHFEQEQRKKAEQALLQHKAPDESGPKGPSDAQANAKAAQTYLDSTTLAANREHGAALALCAQIPTSSPWRARAKEECNRLFDKSLITARQARRQGRCLEYQTHLNALFGYAPEEKVVAQLKALPCVEKGSAGKAVAVRPAPPPTPPPAPAVKPPPKETLAVKPVPKEAPAVKPVPKEAPAVKPVPKEAPASVATKPKGKGEKGKNGLSLKMMSEKEDVDWLDGAGNSKSTAPEK